jgi:arsenite methyltransferase
MKPLYQSPPVRQGLGSCLRPGGQTLTDRILNLLVPDPTSRILDAGCGPGASMVFLQKRGMHNVLGLDLDEGLLKETRHGGRPVAKADLAHLPLPNTCLDMVLCECVWNLTERERVLAEFFRVLKPGAPVALTDIYSRSVGSAGPPGTWPVHCCFSKAMDLATVRQMVVGAGFEINILEDHTSLLKQTAAEFVFAHGSLLAFWQAGTGDADLARAACDASSATRPGLFLLIAQRSDS